MKSQTKKVGTNKVTKKKATPKKASPVNVGIKKEYLKSKKAVKVTFRLPKIAASGAKNVHIVGDFNDWSVYANPMKKLKKGEYTVTLELKSGKEYQFRYIVDESRWENDWNADKYVKSPFGTDNSVVIV